MSRSIARMSFLGLVLALAGLAAASPLGAADRLMADVSEYLVRIDQSFAGKKIHIFGVFDPSTADRNDDGFLVKPPPPTDIVVILKGPPEVVTVRQKERVAGVWVNRHMAAFEDVPSFLSLASNRSLDLVAGPGVLARNGLSFEAAGRIARPAEAPEEKMFREALVRLKQDEGLFVAQAEPVRLRDGRLFHATLDLPSQAPVGRYSAAVFALQNGQVVTAQTIPIVVQKSGIEDALHKFAHGAPLLYGLFAVGAAMGFGLAAASVFNRP